jgi:hypothetical protein
MQALLNQLHRTTSHSGRMKVQPVMTPAAASASFMSDLRYVLPRTVWSRTLSQRSTGMRNQEDTKRTVAIPIVDEN